MRLFIACEIDDSIKGRLAGTVQNGEAVISGVTWVSPDAIHFTLKFLGEVDDAAAEEIKTVLEEPLANVAPFDVRVQGLGCFSTRGTPRVVWAGVSEGAGELGDLKKTVDTAMESIGFERETRDFTAHATLGRVRRGIYPSGVHGFTRDGKELGFGQQHVEAVSLVRSVLQPTGAAYTTIHRWKLENNGGD